MPNSEIRTEFTIRTATQTLPLVRMIVEDIVELASEIADSRERLESLTAHRDATDLEDEYAKELACSENATERKSEKLTQLQHELVELGAIPLTKQNQFVDFPAVRENEPICLCWQLGENEVMYWHYDHEDCSARRLVDLSLIRQSGERSSAELTQPSH